MLFEETHLRKIPIVIKIHECFLSISIHKSCTIDAFYLFDSVITLKEFHSEAGKIQ